MVNQSGFKKYGTPVFDLDHMDRLIEFFGHGDIDLTNWLENIPKIYHQKVLNIINEIDFEPFIGTLATKQQKCAFVEYLHHRIWRSLQITHFERDLALLEDNIIKRGRETETAPLVER